MRKRLLAVAAVCVTATIGFAAASTVSASTTAATGQTQMHVGFKIGKFVKSGHRLVAKGTVTTRATTPDGVQHTSAKPFTAHVTMRGLHLLSTQQTCAVLNLTLDKLSLTLLGLNVNLDKVVLTISANADEGVLGSLFCQLAHSKVKLSAATTARKLTHAMRASGISSSDKLLGVSTPMKAQTQSTAGVACPILDLVLGPLHLDLLGLIVDLNQVHLSITADPTGGVLGSLFCSVAGSTTTITTPTTTTQTTTT